MIETEKTAATFTTDTDRIRIEGALATLSARRFIYGVRGMGLSCCCSTAGGQRRVIVASEQPVDGEIGIALSPQASFWSVQVLHGREAHDSEASHWDLVDYLCAQVRAAKQNKEKGETA